MKTKSKSTKGTARTSTEKGTVLFSNLTDKSRFINILSLTIHTEIGEDEKNFPAQQEKKKKESWFSCAHAD
jgi:hypothetical protein